MHIHTVKDGDTVFKIARSYSTSPLKIIENNALEAPDFLAVGEELLILTPTRTYTVRGSDSLSKIARRFGTKKNMLLANNPYLCGEDRTYPGEILAIKYDTPTRASISSNGYCFKGYDKERLMRALPYLTYLTVGCAIWERGRLSYTFDDNEILKLGREAGKITLLRVYDKSGDLPRSTDAQDAVISNIIDAAKQKGYGGITLSLSVPTGENKAEEAEFLLKMRKRMLGCDLILFNETNAQTPSEICELSDANVFLYDKCAAEDIESFEEGEKKAYTHFSETAESSKTFIDLPSFAYTDGEPIETEDAKKLARRRRCEIKTNEEALIQSFEYTEFSGGKAQARTVIYESLKNTKAKLELVDELGFMGVSFDVSRVNVPTLMMIQTMFSHQQAYICSYEEM